MAYFRYVARNENGSAARGAIEAEDRRVALRLLRDRGIFPSSLEVGRDGGVRTAELVPPRREPPTIDEARDPGSSKARVTPLTERDPPVEKPAPTRSARASRRSEARSGEGGRVRRREITALTRELATLLEADIPILAALEGLEEQEATPALAVLIGDLAEDLRAGVSFSEALANRPREFSTLYTSMVKVGEESGSLPTVLGELADLLESEDEVRSEVLGAIAYPTFVLAMGIATTIVLLAFVLPRLFSMLEGMLDTLPLPTRVLLGVSDFMQAYGLWIVIGSLVATWALREYVRSPRGAIAWDRSKLRLPILGPVFAAAALGRFARTLGTLTRSGLSLLPALEIVRGTVGNRFVSQGVDRVIEDTRGGDMLATPLAALGLFPPTMVRMIRVGEESGRLDSMLLRIAAIQERALRTKSRALISLLAPALILVVGSLVGFIVIALLLPIFQMSNAIG